MTGFQHLFTAGPGIGRVMLVVAVDRYNTGAFGPVFQEVTEGVFQSCALTLIHLVMEQVDLGVLGGQICKVVKVFCLTAVVDQNDIGKTMLQQTVNDGNELFIRIKRGQNDRDFGQVCHIQSPLSVLRIDSHIKLSIL